MAFSTATQEDRDYKEYVLDVWELEYKAWLKGEGPEPPTHKIRTVQMERKPGGCPARTATNLVSGFQNYEKRQVEAIHDGQGNKIVERFVD